MLTGKHILGCEIFDLDTLNQLFELADVLVPVAKGLKRTDVLRGAVLGSLFFEPSTRTRLSFDSAFIRLGGSVSATTGFTFSSIIKGESLSDTSRVVSGYTDVLVVRHPDESSIHEIAGSTHVPVINGGNGAGEHPTQALLDLYTIMRELKRMQRSLEDSTIVIAGDLKFGRTIHSLVKLLALFNPQKFIFVSPTNLLLPNNLIQYLTARHQAIEQVQDLKGALPEADIIYTTRMQTERFPEGEQALAYAEDFRLDQQVFNTYGKKDAIIMHPLPRDSRPNSNCLSNDLDDDPRLAIFRQTDAGVPIRMALFASVLGVREQVKNSLEDTPWYTPHYCGPNDAKFYMRNPNNRPL